MVGYEALETAFLATIEKNRRGKTMQPCPREALSAPAFFFPNRPASGPPPVSNVLREGVETSFMPTKLPFDLCWIVTDYKGLAIVALAEQQGPIIRPDYLWYPVAMPGHPVLTNEREMSGRASFVIDKAIFAVTNNERETVETEQLRILNAGRARAKNNPLPPLPEFIRVSNEPRRVSERSEPTGITKQPHDRRGHYRTYRSGKQVWVRSCRIHGGSEEPRIYHA